MQFLYLVDIKVTELYDDLLKLIVEVDGEFVYDSYAVDKFREDYEIAHACLEMAKRLNCVKTSGIECDIDWCSVVMATHNYYASQLVHIVEQYHNIIEHDEN